MYFNMAGKKMILDRGRYKTLNNVGSMSSKKKSKAMKEADISIKSNIRAQEGRVLATNQFVPPTGGK